MAIDDIDLKLFEIIYAANPDKPMEFVQEQVYRAKLALNEVNATIRAAQEATEAQPEKHIFAELKKSDMVLKTRAEIDAALGDDSVTCCICGKKLVSLGAHLKRTHNINPDDYIKVCGYPEGTSLMAKKALINARKRVKKALSVRQASLQVHHQETEQA